MIDEFCLYSLNTADGLANLKPQVFKLACNDLMTSVGLSSIVWAANERYFLTHANGENYLRVFAKDNALNYLHHVETELKQIDAHAQPTSITDFFFQIMPRSQKTNVPEG